VTVYAIAPGKPFAPLPLPGSWLLPGRLPSAVNIQLAQQLKAQGNWYSQHGQYAQAVQYYTEALEANPVYSDAWFNLATLHREQQQWHQAIPAYQQVLQLNPQDVDAALRLAECYDYGGQPRQAVQGFDRVLTLQPGHDVARRKKAWLLFRLSTQALDAVAPQLSGQLFAQKQRHAFEQAHRVLDSLARDEGLAVSPRLRQVACKALTFQPGSSSLAEYDAVTDSIHTIPELMFAHPAVLAAYLAHEYVHANDRDNASDVDEELRGYLASIGVWQRRKGTMTEPNLDYATALYQQGETDLRQRIANVYINHGHLTSNIITPVWR
jgi:predicted TPR repeat methyltransferase